MSQTRLWALLLATPRVSASLGPAESPGGDVRRVRLEQGDALSVAAVSELSEGAFAYIDGVPARFQNDKPLDWGVSERVVFTRSPRGRSLFAVCGTAADCRQLVVIARRERLVWALRIVQMPPRNALLASFCLLLWATVAWRLRH